MKTIITTLLLTLLLLPSLVHAHYKDWNETDKRLFKLLVVGSVIDYVQTKNALDNNYRESNPFYGSNPHSDRLLIQKGLSLGVIYWSMHTIEYEPYRRKGLLILNGFQWGVVIHNETVGASFTFNW